MNLFDRFLQMKAKREEEKEKLEIVFVIVTW
jgi:hypothetical protein